MCGAPWRISLAKEPRRRRPLEGHVQLGGDVAGEFAHGVGGGIEGAERLQPVGQRAFQHGFVDVVLAAEVIEQVRLGEAAAGGDLVDGAAAVTIGRKHLQRRVQDDLLVLRLDARFPFRLCLGLGHG
jgi:hypothetical protein